MPFIEIIRTWTDSDGMVKLEVIASNGDQVGKQDFYIYPEGLEDFGNQLKNFPQTSKDEVVLEYGEAPDYYCYFLLRAMVLDGVGHSALEFQANNRKNPPEKAEAHFFMEAEPARINSFGKKLCSWVKNMELEFRVEW